MTLWLDNRVELEFPIQPQLFYLARMIAAAVASRARFGRDQIEDLRLAVDELIVTLIRGRTPETTVHIDYEWNEDAIEVVASLYEGFGMADRSQVKLVVDDALAEELSECILGAVVDQHGLPSGDQVPISWLRLRRRQEVF